MSSAYWQERANYLGQAFNSLALQLASPCHRCAEWIIHGLIPIRLGNFGNQSHYGTELTYRVASCALALFLSPITLPSWVASGLIDKMGDGIKTTPFTYWQGRAELTDQPQTYTFFSWNTCMLFGPLPILFGGVAPARERIEAAGKLILDQKADFVLLQEVSFGPAARLYTQLKDHYAHFYTRIAPSPWLMMDTALFVASKYPILSEPQFVLFSSGTMKRGLFCFETKECWVLTTHLEAGSFQESGEMRQKQMGIILKTIGDLKQKSNKPCFLAGDFNAARTGSLDDEYHSLQIPTSFYDAYPFSEGMGSCTERLSAVMMGRKERSKDELIDYALIDEKPISTDIELIPTYQLDRPDSALSDHHGLLTRVRFD